MISSTSGLALRTSMVWSMIGLPAILMSCFGMSRPTRVPTPPARTTATVRIEVTAGSLRRPVRPPRRYRVRRRRGVRAGTGVGALHRLVAGVVDRAVQLGQPGAASAPLQLDHLGG